jgi:hypothetical protein
VLDVLGKQINTSNYYFNQLFQICDTSGVGGWRGLGRKSAHAKYKYPAVEVTKWPIPPVCCRKAIVLRVRLSRLATTWSFYLHLGGRTPKIQIACGRDSHRRRDPKQAVSQILSVRRRAPFDAVHTIFEILRVYENLVIKWLLAFLYRGTRIAHFSEKVGFLKNVQFWWA